MSHNGPYSGPPWSGGRPEEPYAEPSDPWGENRSDPAWEAPPIPHQQYPAYQSPAPAPPSSPPPRSQRGFAVAALIAVLSVLVGGGLATTVWFLLGRKGQAETPVADSSTAVNAARPQTSADARFAAVGQCVRNSGTNTEPELSIVACASNTYEVLKRFDGKTTGEKDAVAKCSKVTGYTKWYYYDTEYDDVDFVLCLREYPAN
ncbi:LppU/SCO3897 family protein [Actinoplanes sp. HUAS TT8]|uniref:LppU/SCO3897 family protein n=1 Tax=Actinoplanes sp. HUAS TT8 TaxID=3447453 RepID=UPI003F51B33C